VDEMVTELVARELEQEPSEAALEPPPSESL
jgi:hypothetical protein